MGEICNNESEFESLDEETKMIVEKLCGCYHISDENKFLETITKSKIKIHDKSGGNVLLFEFLYFAWLQEIKGIVDDDTYIESFFKCVGDSDRNVRVRYDKDRLKHYSELIVQIVSSESAKWDILMLLKAKTCSQPHEQVMKDNLVFKFESELGINRKVLQVNIINNSKQRITEYYDDSLLQKHIPFFHYPLYAVKPASENPYNKYRDNIKLKNFVGLKNKYLGQIDSTLNKITDKSTCLCMKIVNEYCLEATYGFEIKKAIANFLSKNIDDTINLYSTDYVQSFKNQVICDIITNNSFDIKVPGKYGNCKPMDFDSLYPYLTFPEKNTIKNAFKQRQQEIPKYINNREDNTSDNKSTPDSGYVLMFLLYGKAVCEKYSKELISRIKEKHSSQTELTLLQSAKITNKLICIINFVLNNFDLSLPKSGSLSKDDYQLVSKIMQYDDGTLINKDEYTVGDILNGITNQRIRKFDARISKNERYIDISKTKTNLFMRTECSAIEQFYLCVCQDEKEKAGNEETPKVNNANIRQFKSLVLTLIDNCFDEPCVFYRDKRFLNYYLPPDHLVDRCDGAWTQYKEYNHLFSEFAGGRDVLAVTRLQCFQKMADDEDYRCIGQILHHILGHLISSLERTLETVSCYYISKYYRKIYNEELYEYVQKNLPNLSLDEKADMISQKIQNEIARM